MKDNKPPPAQAEPMIDAKQAASALRLPYYWFADHAMRARGFAPKLDLRTWRAYGNFTGMLLVRSMERAERVEESMRCRGFSGKFPLRATRALSFVDFAFLSTLACAITALIALDRLA